MITIFPVAAITCSAVNHRGQTDVEDIPVSAATVYPNPNKGECKIVINAGKQRSDATIQIVNSYGELLREMNGINNNGIITLKISENNLAAGLYQLKYRIGKEWRSMKVVIQK